MHCACVFDVLGASFHMHLRADLLAQHCFLLLPQLTCDHPPALPSFLQLVAVKVIDMLPSQRRQVAAALRECELMSQMEHECVVKLHKFYSAQVRRHRHQVLDTG